MNIVKKINYIYFRKKYFKKENKLNKLKNYKF